MADAIISGLSSEEQSGESSLSNEICIKWAFQAINSPELLLTLDLRYEGKSSKLFAVVFFLAEKSC
jgi:hypothetical protein